MRAWIIACVVFVTGCDSKATASDPQSATPRAEAKSREYESCGASMHCADDLRCFDQTCRRASRSTVGDYYAALGATARGRGDNEAAIAAYTSALGHYDSEKLSLPPDVDCAYGGALAAARSSKESARLAARVLHRCVLAAPVGSPIRDKALTELATLHEAGLDPLLIGAPKLADLYLTKGPSKPATDKLSVAVNATPAPKNFSLIVGKLGEPDIRGALIACWDQYHAAAKKDVMTASVGVKSRYQGSEYEDEPGRYVLSYEPAVAMPAGPEATADACVRQIVEPALKTLKLNENFTSKLTVTVK